MNMKYTIEVKEELAREVEIEAENETEAIKKVQQMYEDEEIVLSSSDFVETNFDVICEMEIEKEIEEIEDHEHER